MAVLHWRPMVNGNPAFAGESHRRLNQLTGDWVLVSPDRHQRPWLGEQGPEQTARPPSYDPACYLCPGNPRAGGLVNPSYTETFVFDNDFPSLVMDAQEPLARSDDLLCAEAERGICRVVCYSPRHDLTMAEMDTAGIRKVVDVWAGQYGELAATDGIGHVQIFENKGLQMGCSNPHPHGQIWATEGVPDIPRREGMRQGEYHEKTGRTLLSDYAAAELDARVRVVCEAQGWLAVVPFWACWPFETLVMPVRPVARITDLTEDERDGFAEVLRRVTVRYDNLFAAPFPYSMGIHQAPTMADEAAHWHLHVHFLPPLLRSATVRKFMVGFEMLAMPQRDMTPEAAAEHLRRQSETHYRAGLDGR